MAVCWTPRPKRPKYVNSPETSLFTKGKVLYGLDKSKRALIDQETAIVCEGQLDLISAFESGVQNIIAPQGTAFTSDQARVLQRFVETVVLCFDSDRAGQEAVTRSLPALLEHGLDVRVARLPQGEDPDSLIRGQGLGGVPRRGGCCEEFFDHALEVLAERGTLDDPAGKSAAARRLGPYVAHIKDKVLLDATAKKICARLGIPEAAFAQNIKVTSQTSNEPADQKPQIAPLPLSEGVRQLCRLAIFNPEVRAWLAAQQAPRPEDLGEGGGFLARILTSSLAIEDRRLAQPCGRAECRRGIDPGPRSISIGLPATLWPLAQNLWFGLAAWSFDPGGLARPLPRSGNPGLPRRAPSSPNPHQRDTANKSLTSNPG